MTFSESNYKWTYSMGHLDDANHITAYTCLRLAEDQITLQCTEWYEYLLGQSFTSTTTHQPQPDGDRPHCVLLIESLQLYPTVSIVSLLFRRLTLNCWILENSTKYPLCEYMTDFHLTIPMTGYCCIRLTFIYRLLPTKRSNAVVDSALTETTCPMTNCLISSHIT